jgi:hypothetical protein
MVLPHENTAAKRARIFARERLSVDTRETEALLTKGIVDVAGSKTA